MPKTLSRDNQLTDHDSSQSKVARLLPGGTLNQPPQSIYDKNIAEGLMERVVKADTVAASFQATVDGIQRDGNLTRKGQRAAIIEAAKITLTELNAAMPAGYGDQIKQLEASLNEPAKNVYGKPVERSETGQLLDYLREREMRDHLRERDALELAADYTSAITSEQNVLLVSAIENSPVPLLPADVIARGRQTRLERQAPETAAKLSDIRAARSYLESTIEGLRRHVSEQADLLLPKSVSEQSSGNPA